MMQSSNFWLRQTGYNLRTNLLFRPTLILLFYIGIGIIFPALEYKLSSLSAGFEQFRVWIATEPGTAQTLMATVAGSLMTVVSVVYSILLVALSLASMQFSTRILAGFMRDQISQNVLGQFIGTFAYCLLILRATRTEPAWVPGVSLTLALGLTLVSLTALALFIHHIIRSIQANVLADRIATETEQVMDAVFVGPAQPIARPEASLPFVLLAQTSGYVQLIDAPRLGGLARGRTMVVMRQMGSFVAAGVPLIGSTEAFSESEKAEFLECFDLGPDRTMQDDVEFGFRQLVDIALKAVSPAVNDPSTAATCIDQLGRLLIRAAQRPSPQTQYQSVYVPNTCLASLIDLSLGQLRQYGRTDMAVCLRLARILTELIPLTSNPTAHEHIRNHAHIIHSEAHKHFPAQDCEELDRRIGPCLLADQGPTNK